ncbi:MAG: alcohol dehydrogenase catalytic domain-containing protein [Candidatus Electryoneaceae bacterium]|nr:alcohol dehydrogenase catalytic domain-containing protein [Candidatus Electryoneaceae bacterium]
MTEVIFNDVRFNPTKTISSNMNALRFIDGHLGLQDGPIPSPSKGEALIKISSAGICATDLEIVKGYMGFEGTLGHEFIGIVQGCDDLPELEGKRVVGEINAGCGYCDWCRRGLSRHCPDRNVLGILGRDGAFAEYLTLPAENLHIVPDNVPDRSAVFTEPLAAAYEILEQVHLIPGTAVLVIGDGRLAQLVVRVLSRVGCYVEAVGRLENKLKRMKGFINRAYLNTPPPGRKYPIVVEASGSPDGWINAVESVEPRGTIVLKSTYAKGFDFNPAPLVINEITLIGSRCGRFAPTLAALSDGLDPTVLIDAEFPLDHWEEAFTMARKPETLKVLFNIG